nr:hypothetical protein [uncultured Sphaerochaeta sp.]
MVWDAHARQVVQEAVEGKINRFRASARLNVSLRTVQRKMKEYRERGEECFHGNKGKAPSNKVDLDAIIAFIEEHDLSGCNFTWPGSWMNTRDLHILFLPAQEDVHPLGEVQEEDTQETEEAPQMDAGAGFRSWTGSAPRCSRPLRRKT